VPLAEQDAPTTRSPGDTPPDGLISPATPRFRYSLLASSLRANKVVAEVWLGRIVSALLVWTAGIFSVYREVFGSGFDRIQGDVGDARLLIYLNEHWLTALKGHTAWRDPGSFYPQSGVLGYSDTLFLYQPFYAPFRALGFDPFKSYQLTVMALSTIGFVGALWFVHRVLRVRWCLSLLGASLFAFSNALTIKSGHSQLYAVNFIPFIGLALAYVVRSISSHPRRAILGGGVVGLLLALLLFTSFYIGWFTIVAFAVVAGCCAIATGGALRQWATAHRHAWRTSALAAAAMSVGFCAGLCPFLMTYLPALRTVGPRQYDDVLLYAPHASDLVNVGANNLVWGALLRAAGMPASQLGNGERSLAVTPVLVAVALVGTIAILVAKRGTASGLRARLLAGVVCGGVIIGITPVHVGDLSVWRLLRAAVPGATAIRAVGRFDLLANVVFVIGVVLVLELALTTWESRPRRYRLLGPVLVMALALLMATEQVQIDQGIHLPRSDQLAMLAAVPPIPASCRAFYVIDPLTGSPPFEPQLDAMLIALSAGVPTLNGYSGQVPPGWGLADVATPGYLDSVETWRERFGLTDGICSYSLSNRTWNPATHGAQATGL
jgi:hypothetical protein